LSGTAAGKELTETQDERSGRARVMLDIIFIAATAIFFTLGIFYVRGCERLK
jgi:hypothetical protein